MNHATSFSTIRVNAIYKIVLVVFVVASGFFDITVK